MIDARPKRIAVVESDQVCPPDWTRYEIGNDIIVACPEQVSFLDPWHPMIQDASLLAGTLEFCDRTTRRPKATWGRRFSLLLPMHKISYWNRDKVLTGLCEALNLLTGDFWEIQFVPRRQQAPRPLQPRLRGLDLRDTSASILPFSDGLDSLTSLILSEQTHIGKVVPVRVQRISLSAIASDTKTGPFVRYPFVARFRRAPSRETSFRTRGFTFAIAAGLAAHQFGSQQVVIPESGQGALGPSLVPVGHSHPDYRCHPRFYEKMGVFLKSLLGTTMSFQYPHLWDTKGETIAQGVQSRRWQRHWSGTRSCWQDSRHASVEGRRRQCGICSACLLRRMSLQSAGVSEDPEVYVAEDLTSPDFASSLAKGFSRRDRPDALRSHGIAGVLQMESLARLAHHCGSGDWLCRDVVFLSQCLGENRHCIRRRLKRLVSQHAREWNSFRESLGTESFLNHWAETGAKG